MDSGPTDGPPGTALKTVSATLTTAEALDLLAALEFWAEEVDAGEPDPGWHTHIADADGNELTIAVALEGDPRFAKRLTKPS